MTEGGEVKLSSGKCSIEASKGRADVLHYTQHWKSFYEPSWDTGRRRRLGAEVMIVFIFLFIIM